jgi:hypothetical protein
MVGKPDMKKFLLLTAALSFAALSGPAFAETTIPTTPDGAKGVCKGGKTECSMVPCGSTLCSAHCPSPTDCYVIVFLKKAKHPPVVLHPKKVS